MSAPELAAAFHESLRRLGHPLPSYSLPHDEATREGEDLYRSPRGLSRGARRLSRCPWVPRVWEPFEDEVARALGDYREEAS